MNVSTGINGSAYLGARWYSLSKVHIFDIFQFVVSDDKNIGEHVFDIGWQEICKVYDLDRQEYIAEIRAAYERVEIIFYHREQYEREKRETKKSTR